MNTPPFSTLVKLTLASVILGLGAFVFAGVPLVVSRRLFPLKAFLAAQGTAVLLLFLAGLAPFAFFQAALTLMVTVFEYSRARQPSVALAGLTGFLAAGLASAATLGGYVGFFGARVFESLKGELQGIATRISEISPQLKLDVDALWHQLPGVASFFLIAAFAIGVIVEKSMLRWMGSDDDTRPQQSLLDFRLPSALVWVAIAVLLGAFWDLSPAVVKTISLNLFYVLVIGYCLQGLAIVATFFEVAKVGPLWRSLWYFMILTQLLLVIATLGFSDYWVDYRQRILKAAESKKT